MEKSICVDGKEVRMRASALVPRLYRFKFGRDIIKDINQLKRAYKKAESLPEDATDEEREDMQLSLMDLSIFENVAYIMAKHADPENVAGTIDEWMEQFSMFSIYGVFPQLLELWEEGTATTSLPKKK